jgi:hypothetical protein
MCTAGKAKDEYGSGKHSPHASEAHEKTLDKTWKQNGHGLD